MNTHELMQQALIDEAVPRPEGLEAHLASCEACGSFAAAHRAALRLRGATLSASRRRPLAAVQRRAGILGGLVLALGGGFGLLALRLEEHVVLVERAAPEQPVLIIQAPEGDLFALAQLQATITSELTRDPREDAAAVRAFGALPRWTAPTRTQPIRSLGRSASPVVFTSEDSP